MHDIRATAFPNIKPGNAAMYYPECNVLVSRTLDPQSKTPAFKGVIVRVEPASTDSRRAHSAGTPQLVQLSAPSSIG